MFRRMFELMRKDLEQNATPLGLFFGLGLGLPALLALLKGGSESADFYVGAVMPIIVFGGGLVLPGMFIGDEKAKGTFRSLAMLPISPALMVCAKFLLIVGVVLAVALISLVAMPWVFVQVGLGLPPISWVVVLWMVTAGLLSVAVSASLFFALNNKLALQLAYLVILLVAFAPIGVMSALEARGAATAVEAALSRTPVVVGALMLAVALVAVGILFSANTMKWKDWTDLGVER